MEKLKDLAHDLDYELGNIGLEVRTLDDVQVLFRQLAEDMDQADHDGNQMFCYQDHHRRIRVLKELMTFSMEKLQESYKKARDINETMFQEGVKDAEPSVQSVRYG